MSLMQLAQDERTSFLEFLTTLSPEQWEAPTLCEGWRVRDVVAHAVSYDELDWPGVLRRSARGRFRLGRANAVGVAANAQRSPEDLLQVLNAHLRPRGLTAAFGGMVALVDGMIHQQDIRRPLGLPRDIPAERLVPTLRSAMKAPPIGAFWRARGLRLVATDCDWSAGRGPEVRGAGEAILMAVAGRRGVVQELSGEGQGTLAGRIHAA
ncbi:MAG: maleylpyruvate isomerase family mycothiol-dependent enzyme [Streptosporangiales bacterium]